MQMYAYLTKAQISHYLVYAVLNSLNTDSMINVGLNTKT